MVFDVASLIPLMIKLNVDLQLWSLQSVNELSYLYSQSYIEGISLISLFISSDSAFVAFLLY